MEDLTNEVRRIIRNINLDTNVGQILEEIPLTYHPPKDIGKKKYKDEVILAHSHYHQDTQLPCVIYEHFTPLDMDTIIDQRRNTEGALPCDNLAKTSIYSHAFVKAWCKKVTFTLGVTSLVSTNKKNNKTTQNNNLKVEQRALDRWFGHLDGSAYNQEQASFQPPPPHWCERNDIHDLCIICGEVLKLNTEPSNKTINICDFCENSNCMPVPGESCSGMCNQQCYNDIRTGKIKNGLF